METFDYQKFFENFGEDKEIADPLLRQFFEEILEERLGELHCEMKNKDYEKIRLSAIKIDVCCYFGIKKLFSLAKTLWKSAEEGKEFSVLLNEYLEVLEETKELKKQIAEVLGVVPDLKKIEHWEAEIIGINAHLFFSLKEK